MCFRPKMKLNSFIFDFSNHYLPMRTRDEQKVVRIYDAALRIIATKGLVGLKMGELAQEARIATGTLYIYFSDKESLLQALHADVSDRMSKWIWGTELQGATIEQRFRQKWYNYLQFVIKHPEETAFLEQFQRSTYATQTRSGAVEEMLAPLLQVLAEGQAEGIIRKAPLNLLLAQLTGSLKEILQLHAAGQLPPIANITHIAWDMAWNSVKR